MSTNLQIQLDPVALREATTQALMGILTPDIKNKLISDAITALLRPSTDSWRQNKSPLQEAFEAAVFNVARDSCLSIVKSDPEVGAKIAALTKEAADKVFKMDADKLAQKMADAFIAACGRD